MMPVILHYNDYMPHKDWDNLENRSKLSANLSKQMSL